MPDDLPYPLPIMLGTSNPNAPDPILQTTPLPQVLTTPGLNFLGQGNSFPLPPPFGYFVLSEPPDTNGSVGTTQYVQWVNTTFTVFDKTTGATLLGPLDGNSLFSALPASSICNTTNRGDPIAQFDKLNSRWVLTQFAFSAEIGGSYGQCIAVSTTDDATGTYAVYEFDFPDFPDYPKLGVWPDAYYITYNMFSHVDLHFLNAKACAYDGAAMRAGTAATSVCFDTTSSHFSLLPGDVDGTTLPPAGAPNPLFELHDSADLNRFKFHVNFVTPASSTFTGPTIIPVTPFTFACGGSGGTCVNQPSPTAQLLDTLGGRLMYRAAYRNFIGSREVVLLSHSVDATGAPNHFTGVRWYEIRDPNGTATVFQSSTFAPPTSEHRWMSSLAQDKLGNMLMGYSVSGAGAFPSIRFTGRTRGEPRGFMETEDIIITGTGSQDGHSRWGDYSSMSVDPVDDCTFWYTQEYIISPGGDFIWDTRIASFKFPNCS
jgi:hypothetical protein